MTSRDFCYWLQGYFELRNGQASGWSTEQAATVQRHLAMVFVHEIDPSFPREQQGALDAAHVAAGDLKKPFDPKSLTVDHAAIGGVGPGGVLYRC